MPPLSPGQPSDREVLRALRQSFRPGLCGLRGAALRLGKFLSAVRMSNLGHYERALHGGWVGGRVGSINYYWGGLPALVRDERFPRAERIALARQFLPLKDRERRAWWRYRARRYLADHNRVCF